MPRGVYRRPGLAGRYGWLEPLEVAGVDARGNRRWRCKCQRCGGYWTTVGYALKRKRGGVRSCGCAGRGPAGKLRMQHTADSQLTPSAPDG